MLKIRRFQSIYSRLSRNLTTSEPRQFTYFDNVEVKEDVAIIRFNGPGKMNTVSPGIQADADKIFREVLPTHKNVKAIVFMSSKPDNFIAGADIEMIKTLKKKSDLYDMTMTAHKLFDEMKAKGLPMVAALNGSTLGAGLEWALYCDYRIATTSKKTVLGLPEVKLGLMPGMGGTYHLPRLVGYPAALDMMLTGKNIRPDKAKKMGLVDLVVDPASLERVAITQAKLLAEGRLHPSKGKKKGLMDRLLEGTPMGRSVIFRKAREGVDKETRGKYPAPYRIIEVLENNHGKSKQEHLKDEATKFAALADTDVSRALIGLFFGTTAVKKHSFPAPSHPVNTVAVLGAGLMGAGIAQVSVDNGKYLTLLKDKFPEGLAKGEKTIQEALHAKMKKKRMTNHEYCATSSRLVLLHDDLPQWPSHFSKADVVVEAVFEDINVKHAVLKELEPIIPPHCIFASNTSAIPIADIAKGAQRPDRVVGMHYFSPVPLMPLLEIIPHQGTAPEVVSAAMEIGARQGKTCILVKDVAGFFVNRCLTPFQVEVSALIGEGVGLKELDKALRNFGMPVGPVTLSDEVGVDIAYHVGSFMAKADLGVRMQGGNMELMKEMLDRKWLGRKSGKGFYLYPKDAKKGAEKELNPELVSLLSQHLKLKGIAAPKTLSEDEIQFRVISRFVNEAAFSLQDNIIRAPADGDIGAVFGIGFPPNLGGPFRMLDLYEGGVKAFTDRMFRYRDQLGPQFEPAQILKDYAATNKKFHN